MNAYDFDHCIYAGDCTIDFYRFCLKQKPALLRYLPRQIWGLVLFAFAFIQKTAFKERFFCFLQGLEDRDALITSLVPALQPGDVVLAKGSHAFAMDAVIKAILEREELT